MKRKIQNEFRRKNKKIKKSFWNVKKITIKVILKLTSKLKSSYFLNYLKVKLRKYLAKTTRTLLIWNLKSIISNFLIKLTLILKR